MSWITPVTDRVPADVAALNSKGVFDPDTANRIEGNTEFLSDLLDAYGYSNTETHETDWVRNDLFRISDVERIRNNVETLTEVYHDEKPLTYADVGAQTYAACGATVYADLFGTTVPLALRLHYADFNNLELALLNLGSMVDRLAQSFEYCGETYSGE